MSGDLAFAAGLLIGSAGYLAMAWYVFQRRQASGAHALLAVLLSIFVWTACYALEQTTRTVQAAQLWSCLKYLGIVALPPSLLAFVVEYTGRGRRLAPLTLVLLSVEPLIVITLLFVPGLHDLVLVYKPSDVATARLAIAPVPGPGPLFWPHAIYSYGVLVGALGLLGARLARIARPYRRQGVVIIVAAILPIVGNVLYNARTDLVRVDPSPFLMTLFSVVLVWGFFRLRLLDLVPIARGVVMEQMADGVLVLDAYGRVVDTNPAAVALLGVHRRDVVGRLAADLLPRAAELVASHRPGGSTQGEFALTAEELGRAGGEPVHVAVQLSSLTDRRGAESGRLLVVRDVTQRTATERRLRELLDAETHLAAVLQTSLRPASLPMVPGLQLAARSLPAGHGSQVSGDFYDVHQALGGDWAFVLGDVAGKGVQAAVVTSMARYTVRTLSAQGWSPRQVIEQLNQALLVETEIERFCTVVYGRLGQLDPASGDDRPRPGVKLTIALGGHPAPLVRRLDGTIESVGRPGTALGIVSNVDVREVSVDLFPGDVMLAYTDGVTEARRDGYEYGEDRLARTFGAAASRARGHTGAAAAALRAETVADRVVDAATTFAAHRDDVAVLVLAVC